MVMALAFGSVPASADTCTIKVTVLATGQPETLTVDVPPGTTPAAPAGTTLDSYSCAPASSTSSTTTTSTTTRPLPLPSPSSSSTGSSSSSSSSTTPTSTSTSTSPSRT